MNKKMSLEESLNAHNRKFDLYEAGELNLCIKIRATSVKGATVYETIKAIEAAIGTVRADMVEWKFEGK